jgi:hypothetical protein
VRKTFLWFGVLGFLVAAGITANAYLINRSPSAQPMDPILVFSFCPSSILLIATERASRSVQAFLIALTVILNGLIYGALGLLWHALFWKKQTRQK